MRDLLISVQRVCKGWKVTIDSSPILQEALFFRPINNKRLVYRGNNEDEDMKFLLNMDRKPESREGSAPPIYEHPIMTNKCSKIRKYGVRWFLEPECEVMSRPEASWRRQLVTQPPLAELNWWDRSRFEFKSTGTVRASSSDKGLTLGDFAQEFYLHFTTDYEVWSWLSVGWDHAPAVSAIGPARFAAYTEGPWIAE